MHLDLARSTGLVSLETDVLRRVRTGGGVLLVWQRRRSIRYRLQPNPAPPSGAGESGTSAIEPGGNGAVSNSRLSIGQSRTGRLVMRSFATVNAHQVTNPPSSKAMATSMAFRTSISLLSCHRKVGNKKEGHGRDLPQKYPGWYGQLGSGLPGHIGSVTRAILSRCSYFTRSAVNSETVSLLS